MDVEADDDGAAAFSAADLRHFDRGMGGGSRYGGIGRGTFLPSTGGTIAQSNMVVLSAAEIDENKELDSSKESASEDESAILAGTAKSIWNSIDHTYAVDWSGGTTKLELGRKVLRVLGIDRKVGRAEGVLKLTQSRSVGNWDAKLSFDVGGAPDGKFKLRQFQRRLATDAEVRARFQELPDLLTSLRTWHDLRSRVNDDGPDAFMEWQIGAALDFTKYLPSQMAPYEPHLKLDIQTVGSAFPRVDASELDPTNVTVRIIGGLKF